MFVRLGATKPSTSDTFQVPSRLWSGCREKSPSISSARCFPAGRVAFGLQVRRHLTCQHLDESGPVHSDRLPVVTGIVHRYEFAGFIHGTPQEHTVVMINP